MRLYRTISLALAAVFGIVGILFLAIPGGVVDFFNDISPSVGLPAMPQTIHNFYVVLAVAYMYIVAVLAFMMYHDPANSFLPLLLAHGKLASSLLSILFFVAVGPFLIFITNFVVDGLIGTLALYFYFKIKRGPGWESS